MTLSASTAKSLPATPAMTSTQGQAIHLAARRMRWDFSALPPSPVAQDASFAAFLLAISYFVVFFEDYGIPVVRGEMGKLTRHPALAREAQAFLTQEALHSQGHVQFNQAMEAQHGLDVDVIAHEEARFMADLRKGSAQDQLANVAAFEHVIFSLAEWYIGATALHGRIHPEFHRLVLWHAMEEMEHTAVVHDMYGHLYGNGSEAYRVRIAALYRSARVTMRTMSRIWRHLLPQMERALGEQTSAVKPWFKLAGESRHYLRDLVRFFEPGFNPFFRDMPADLLPALRARMVPAQRADEGWLTLRVARVVPVSPDVLAYELVAADGAPLPRWDAGAHVDVEIETGIVRQYSLCGDPEDVRRYRIAVRRDASGRGGSLRLQQLVVAGAEVRVGMPRNHFALHADDGAEVLLIAGGIGITPLLAMAQTLHRRGATFALHLCTRSRECLPFADEIAGWSFADRVCVYTDSAAPAGRLNVAALVPAWDAGRPRRLYVCGPAPFIEAVVNAARGGGWPAEAVRFERFAQVVAQRPNDSGFEIHLQRSGLSIAVAATQTVAEAMEAHGLPTQTSCREGVCGACLCDVVSGEVDHRDAVLSETEHREGQRMAICVSRAKGPRLTLDL